ncbi:unnamed protein product [Eruca vesicaria subsp. sativa]|uniref:Uncharacterized protein n=1 Tax=Eruca vesicaria subsp. sativa TaxID=29727 RepID=A0ABC8JB28_ERUVS|nr:unnamed protein product [Eruca vesicaria subsp. sativa]
MSSPQDLTQPTAKPEMFLTHETIHEMLVLANDKRVTKNANGLGFTQFGEIDMSTDWWDQLIKMCPEAAKHRVHPLRDIPLLDSLYHKVTISAAKVGRINKEQANCLNK